MTDTTENVDADGPSLRIVSAERYEAWTQELARDVTKAAWPDSPDKFRTEAQNGAECVALFLRWSMVEPWPGFPQP